MRRLLFIVSEDWYFVSHRLHLAFAAQKAGFEVGVLTRVSRHRATLEQAGIAVFPWSIHRGSRNPLWESRAVAGAIAVRRHYQPDLIHAVAIKPGLYGAFAAQLGRKTPLVMALGGLGFIYRSNRAQARLFRPIVTSALRKALRPSNTRLILQNPNDQALVRAARIVDPKRIRLIKGAGVHTSVFRPHTEPDGPPIVMLAARMLWSKGIGEFVACAHRIKKTNPDVRFVLVGETDPHNPEAVPRTQLQSWHDSGIVEWWGYREDMANVLPQATVVCLPTTYGEGLPKILQEAASCARPILTYDVPGCREAVIHGRNGFLVPPGDDPKWDDALLTLLNDKELRKRMGQAGRSLALQEFSEKRIAQDTLRLWQEVLS